MEAKQVVEKFVVPPQPASVVRAKMLASKAGFDLESEEPSFGHQRWLVLMTSGNALSDGVRIALFFSLDGQLEHVIQQPVVMTTKQNPRPVRKIIANAHLAVEMLAIVLPDWLDENDREQA